MRQIIIVSMTIIMVLISGIDETQADTAKQDTSQYYRSEAFPTDKHLASLVYNHCTFSRSIGKHKNNDGSYTVLFLYQIRSRDGSSLYEYAYPAAIRIWKLDTNTWAARSLKFNPIEEYQIIQNVK